MQKIELTKGKNTLVDDEDFRRISSWNWYATNCGGKWYAVRKNPAGKPYKIYLHRFLLEPPPGLVVDHKNGDTLDNRRKNLRLCTRSQNQFNQGKQKRTKSGLKGAYQTPGGGWYSKIAAFGQSHFLGTFPSKQKAHQAYKRAAKKLHREFAKFS